MKSAKQKLKKPSPKKIVEDFAKLGIGPNQYAPYTDAVDYGKRFKRCSILESVGYTYSSSSAS